MQPEDAPPGLPVLPPYMPREHDEVLGQVARAAGGAAGSRCWWAGPQRVRPWPAGRHRPCYGTRTRKYTLLMVRPGAARRRWRRWGSCRLSPGTRTDRRRHVQGERAMERPGLVRLVRRVPGRPPLGRRRQVRVRLRRRRRVALPLDPEAADRGQDLSPTSRRPGTWASALSPASRCHSQGLPWTSTDSSTAWLTFPWTAITYTTAATNGSCRSDGSTIDPERRRSGKPACSPTRTAPPSCATGSPSINSLPLACFRGDPHRRQATPRPRGQGGCKISGL